MPEFEKKKNWLPEYGQSIKLKSKLDEQEVKSNNDFYEFNNSSLMPEKNHRSWESLIKIRKHQAWVLLLVVLNLVVLLMSFTHFPALVWSIYMCKFMSVLNKESCMYFIYCYTVLLLVLLQFYEYFFQNSA